MSIMKAKADAVVAGLPGRGVPPDYVEAVGACPAGFLMQLLSTLLPLLIGCIPLAKTPDGLQKVCKNPNLMVRLGLSRQLRQAISDNYGDDADGRAAMQALFVPAKQEVLAQMAKLTLEECTALLAEDRQ